MSEDKIKGSTREALLGLIREKSYREGDFTLVSGQKSSYYIDLKTTSLHPDGAHWIGELAVSLFRKEGLEVDAVGGMTLGADPLATAISMKAREENLFWPAFIVRKEPKSHGTSRYIEGTENLPSGAGVLVVEDVVSTGGSSLRAIERIREGGFEPVALLTIVDREMGGREVFEKAGVRFFSLFTVSDLQSEP
jgi:orotate phosphoribosyltransferase